MIMIIFLTSILVILKIKCWEWIMWKSLIILIIWKMLKSIQMKIILIIIIQIILLITLIILIIIVEKAVKWKIKWVQEFLIIILKKLKIYFLLIYLKKPIKNLIQVIAKKQRVKYQLIWKEEQLKFKGFKMMKKVKWMNNYLIPMLLVIKISWMLLMTILLKKTKKLKIKLIGFIII